MRDGVVRTDELPAPPATLINFVHNQDENQESGTEPPLGILKEISTTRKYAAVLALTTGSLALGVNEFVPLGFIPEISKDYSISAAKTAWITSAFMIGAAVSSPLLTIMGSKINQKYFLMSLQSLLIGAGTTSILAPNFETLLAGRVLSACSHAAYMGVGSVVAASLFPESKQGTAISIFFTGLTIANLAGVPLDTLLGEKMGWRYIFWPVNGLALASLLGTISFLPKTQDGIKPDFQKELAVFKKLDVWLALSVSTFGYAGMLASHTYFTEMMTNLAGFTNDDVTWLTAVYGSAAVLGNIFGGKVADKDVVMSMTSLLASLAAVLFTFTYTTHYKVPAAISLFANGFTGFSLIAPLMRYTTSKASDAPRLASACNISAFGAGIALGVFLSGITIDNGFGYESPNWVGGSLTSLGLLIALSNEALSKLCTSSSTTAARLDDQSHTVSAVPQGQESTIVPYHKMKQEQSQPSLLRNGEQDPLLRTKERKKSWYSTM